MYNNRNSQVLERERTNTENVYDGYVNRTFSDNKSQNFEKIKNYEKYLDDTRIPAMDEEVLTATDNESTTYAREDIMPSATTMQFSSEQDEDVYEEIKNDKIDEDKKYRINTKGKVLIAVYAIVIATIFSLIILNAKMLKNIDGTIENYSSQITELNERNDSLAKEYDHVRSNDVVISKAESMGMKKG